ncbi:MAG: trypsin-like peptidase domain-containing protein [Anaerolineales bacterium]|nr:trypsin-like peptidase domain-containing protein [Anaerolineales bacterium]
MSFRRHILNIAHPLLGFVLLVSVHACSLAQIFPTQDSGDPATTDPTPTNAQPSTADLAMATVQIIALGRSDLIRDALWSGSGAIISPEGLILTNAHVVDNRAGEYTSLGIGMTMRTDQPSELQYLAEIAAVDYELDLAIIRIISDIYGEPIDVSLPFVRLGDSDRVEIGDQLRILGYPSIGGETISFTEGAVSGFSLERGIEGRAWIKTDATIAGGSSGGMGVNQVGELVGVATIVTSGSLEGDNVDCRPLADTNQDGRIDQRDTCIPVGGFINALRPVNLVEPLLQAVQAGEAYVAAGPPFMQASDRFDTSDIRLDEMVFSTAVTNDDHPASVVDVILEPTKDLYVFWDYEGLENGMTWGVYWYLDQVYLSEGSLENRRWSGGSAGNWWASLNSDAGLAPGLYEVVIEIEGEVWATEAIFVGESRERVLFEIDNQSELAVCYVMISPTLAQNWGPDELGPTEVIQSGQQRSFDIPAGEYDLWMLDCDFNTLSEEYGLMLDRDGGYILGE